MIWPTASDYTAASQNPRGCFRDPDLQQGQAAVGPMGGLPLVYSGNFAAVYQMCCPSGDSWAVKCFTRRVLDLEKRYDAISRHLLERKLPFMVDFSFLEEGVRIGDSWYPIVKMRWIEGLTLNAFLHEHADKRDVVERLSSMWLLLAEQMRQANLAHGDLQNGNVLLIPGRKDGSLALRLIDYDGMWVPSLANNPPGEVGHPDFQHPERQQRGGYDANIDNFSHLVIYTSMRALTLKAELSKKHDNGENLLFCKADFTEPNNSRLFKELLTLPDVQVHALAGRLLLACRAPLERMRYPFEFSANASVPPLTDDEQARVREVLLSGSPPAETAATSDPLPEWLFSSVVPPVMPQPSPSSQRLPPLPRRAARRTRVRAPERSNAGWWVALAALAFVTLTLAVAIVLAALFGKVPAQEKPGSPNDRPGILNGENPGE
jgi:hypothetical protein